MCKLYFYLLKKHRTKKSHDVNIFKQLQPWLTWHCNLKGNCAFNFEVLTDLNVRSSNTIPRFINKRLILVVQVVTEDKRP